MNSFISSKFSKFLSTCFSFGILFSGFQTYTYGMNSDFADRFYSQNESVLNKVELPTKCEVCNELNVLFVMNDVANKSGGIEDKFCCCSVGCLQKLFNLAAQNAGYEESNIEPCNCISTYNGKPSPAFGVFRCGHSVCFCDNCRIARRENKCLDICPKCNKDFGSPVVVFGLCKSEMEIAKTIRLVRGELEKDWKGKLVVLSKREDQPISSLNVSRMLCNYLRGGYDGVKNVAWRFNEGKFDNINSELSNNKILVFERYTGKIKFIDKSQLEAYLSSQKKQGYNVVYQ